MIRTPPQTFRSSPARFRRGFTLVEMMVAVALVVVMMLMFATVFQTAGGLVSRQKGMAELDQSARTMITLLRGDIKQRTFIDVVPYVAGQDPDAARSYKPDYDPATGDGFAADFRKGYFSISENNPLDPTDDSIHFTITTQSLAKDPDDRDTSLPYSGRASLLRVPEAFGGPMNSDLDTTGERNTYLLGNPDQPEFDDGQIVENQTGSSEFAEVSWFLRNGTLYRRQLMIRRPYNRGGNTTQPEDPQDSMVGNEFIPYAYSPASLAPFPGSKAKGVFWNDFDYSAYGVIVPDPNDPNKTLGAVKFHVTNDPEGAADALDNTSTVAGPGLSGFPASLGVPFLRYGSSTNRWRRDPVDPKDPNGPQIPRIFGPREYLNGDFDLSGNNTPSGYIGRYTIQETSHSNFNYPGNPKGSDPFLRTGLSLNSDSLVGAYANQGDRRGEDIVLKNVHEFDIEVYDDLLQQFVDLGYGGSAVGDYHRNNMRLSDGTFGNNTDYGNRYDTWNPSTEMPNSPPYAPYRQRTAPYQNLSRTGTDLGLGAEEEVWLRAIRIKIRYYDVRSQQMRDLTYTFFLNRENSAK